MNVNQHNAVIIIDVNECVEEKGDCEQACNNVEGSFECSCGPGFVINAEDPSKCDGEYCMLGPYQYTYGSIGWVSWV